MQITHLIKFAHLSIGGSTINSITAVKESSNIKGQIWIKTLPKTTKLESGWKAK